ncbi:hypothetical protein KK137_10900 [Croceibacterium sp. LX-88]|uniref:Uncharacterized protein n=1 Tax=Croceibacterium selenioxidans TaxID=2838833 RepID=A0ABS5W513_9SPHN|nr:hypothetical protein [Croceibacterium selenioxidans]MBT2134843.1 hypothetical protein [Croceibacterium selenioxidans]
MFVPPRIIAAAAAALFILACFYVGYINELLKGSLSPWHRAIVLIGFIIGAGAASRYVANLASNRLARGGQVRR